MPWPVACKPSAGLIKKVTGAVWPWIVVLTLVVAILVAVGVAQFDAVGPIGGPPQLSAQAPVWRHHARHHPRVTGRRACCAGTGRPRAIASTGGRPKPSSSDGKTRARAPA